MMKELLRVTMSRKQVEEACEQWALKRSSYNSVLDDVEVRATIDAEDGLSAEVVFSRKRVRAPRTVSGTKLVPATQE